MQSNQPSSETKKTPSKTTHHLRYTDFQFIKILGMGAYGKVELVRRKGIKYALKIIEKRLLAKQGKQYQAFIERQLLRRMNHPGIVALRTCFQDRHNLYFCLQFCEGGDFTTFINKNQPKITNELRVFYIAEIVTIIQYFQSIGIVHRDLKPENILLSQKGHLKIIDFGTAQVSQCKLVDEKFKEQLSQQKKSAEQGELQASKQLFGSVKKSETSWKSTEKSESSSQEREEQSTITGPRQGRKRKATFVGTCYYVAPELLQKQVCQPATDLWALGCIIYQFYYLIPPFDGGSEFEIFEKIKNIQYSFPKNDNISQDAIDLIKKLLQQNPTDRLGCNSRQGLMMEDLKSHKFFQGFNFDNLFNRQVPLLMQQQNLLNENERKRLQKIGNAVMNEYLSLLQNNPNILIHGVIEKRTFITMNVYYLIVFNNLKILRIKVMEPGKTRETQISLDSHFETKQNLPAEVVDANFFKLITKQKTYNYKCKQPTKWVTIINKRYKHLKQLKQKPQDEISEPQLIQKQCRSITDMLRLHQLPVDQQ